MAGLMGRIGAAWAALTGGGPGGDVLREAVGRTLDDDEDQWRPLTGDARRDLSPLTKARMREISYYLWRANPLANRVIELPLAYILADGTRLVADDEECQAWLDGFWHDPINAMPLSLPKMMRDLALAGEQCWPVFVNEFSGHVRIGYLDPERIETVVRDPDNGRQVIGIVSRRDRKGRSLRFRAIVNGDEHVFSQRTQEIRTTFSDGECFYFAVNDLQGGGGHGDLLPLADWIDGYEEFLFGEVERARYTRAFVWDVTLTGATQEEVEARARQMDAPSSGSIRVHNEAETWQSVAPDLKSADSSEMGRLFRNHVLGGATLPEHWFGGGGDVNRATAGEMGEPTFKMLSARQAMIKHILEAMGDYVIRAHWAKHKRSGEPGPEQRARAEFPEMVAADTSRYAAALQQVVMAAIAALDRGLITDDLALRMVESVASRLGVDFDPRSEIEEARAQAAAAEAADLFPPPPPGEAPARDG